MRFLERLEAEHQKLTASDRVIAQYLIDHHPQAILESASSIARKAKLSAATVVRFFAKLGYNGFAEAQEEVRREVALKLDSPLERIAIMAGERGSTEDFLFRYYSAEIENVRSTFEQVDRTVFNAIAELLLTAKGRVYIVGEKHSYSVAFLLYAHLNVCLDNVVLVDSGEAMIADRLLWVQPDDVLFCVSIRRYSPNGVKSAEYFRSIGAKVIVLTDNQLSPLTPLATHRLVMRTASPSVFDSFTAAMSLAGAITGVVARERRQRVSETLKGAEALWKHFGTFIG